MRLKLSFYKMFKAIKKICLNPTIAIPTIAVFGLTTSVYYGYYCTHPLVRYSREMANNNPKVMETLGKRGRLSFFIHSISNPDDSEYGFAYKIKGKGKFVRVTVIGDYITHEDLININTQKQSFLNECKGDIEKIKKGIHNRSFVPINLSRFCIPSKRFKIMTNKPIKKSHYVWRAKELIVDMPSGYIKISPIDSFQKIVESRYTLQTYEDAYNKMKEVMNEDSETVPGGYGLTQTTVKAKKMYLNKFFLVLLCALSIIGITFIFKRTRVSKSRLENMLMIKLNNSELAKNMLGSKIELLWENTMNYNFIGTRKVKIGVFGGKGEGVIDAKIGKSIFRRGNEDVKSMILTQDKETINLGL